MKPLRNRDVVACQRAAIWADARSTSPSRSAMLRQSSSELALDGITGCSTCRMLSAQPGKPLLKPSISTGSISRPERFGTVTFSWSFEDRSRHIATSGARPTRTHPFVPSTVCFDEEARRKHIRRATDEPLGSVHGYYETIASRACDMAGPNEPTETARYQQALVLRRRLLVTRSKSAAKRGRELPTPAVKPRSRRGSPLIKVDQADPSAGWDAVR